MVTTAAPDLDSHFKAVTLDLLKINVPTKAPQKIAPLDNTDLTSVRLSPDHLDVAYVSMKGGPSDVWVVDQNGRSSQITRNSNQHEFYSSLTWSQDGRSLLYSKQFIKTTLFMIDKFK